jgi:hypothetical protein
MCDPTEGELEMFRKLALALAATAALGTASLAVSSTPAEAKKGHHHHFHKGHFYKGHYHKHYHWRAYRYYPSYAYTGCYVKKWVATPWGYRLRWVNVCF